MQLCEIKRLDDKCRISIPKEYVAGAGGKPNQRAYVSFDEETKEIKITLKQENEADGNG